MRSQTIIAGAIAIAICLISGALVYASQREGGEVRRVIGPRAGEAERPSEGGAVQGTIKSCGEEVGVGPETSCELGLAVWHGEQEPAPGARIAVTDPSSAREVTLRCEAGGASSSLVCAAPGTTVYLPSP